jgi:hypothetical protein
VLSAPGRGTQVRIEWPTEDAAAAPELAQPQALDIAGDRRGDWS